MYPSKAAEGNATAVSSNDSPFSVVAAVGDSCHAAEECEEIVFYYSLRFGRKMFYEMPHKLLKRSEWSRKQEVNNGMVCMIIAVS